MRLIIDCDPGNGIPGANIDDGLALSLALAAPEIALEMITTVSGNTPSEVGFSIAHTLLSIAGQNVPVWRGASQALVEPAGPWRARMDSGAGNSNVKAMWQNVLPPEQQPSGSPLAAHAMGELICNNPGEITLVAIAPLTNIAHALQLYPKMAAAVAEIVIMGGVFNVDGYIKDTNFGIDPEAAHVVLTSGANITLVPMDVTTQTMLTHQDLDRLAQIDSPLSRYLVETIRPWITYSMQTRHLPGCWIHDALTIAYLLDRSLATCKAYHVDVALEGGLTRGTSWCYNPDELRLNVGIPAPQGKAVQVLQSVDNARLLSMIYTFLGQYH
ncbi:hydrolase [Chania multitudinisentens RB-25]|uniref:Hydrolase n=1 Tax=Chania multitudinisentens RB-25 TaxID=1441930 RepID=W0LA34_9GAMM|nr:nucleoside hydrolase [Chania multitudinisentens]AHG20576.1 hydrolase [Chania multitudinisentens RB-25]